jgi:tetratricopeptide (TPR) repeat protein
MESHSTEQMELHNTEGLETDRLYQKSLAHMQRGQWEQAVETILQLQEQYGLTSELEGLLEEARFKAALDQEPLGDRRSAWSERWRRWRPLILWGLSGSLVVVGLLAGLLMYESRVVPARLARQAEARLNELRQQGQFHLAARQYDQAIQIFKDLLANVPDDQTALEGIAAAEEKQTLEALSGRVVELLEAKEWEAAVGLIGKIQAWKPDYGGLDGERGLAEKQMRLEATFEAAEAAYAMAEWEQALLKYGDLQALDRSFQKTVVAERLFQGYVYRGQELVASAGNSLGPVKEAHELFAKALVLHPGDPQVVAERDWAKAYIDGYEAYERGDWERAAQALSQLYLEQPDYPGMTCLMLYEAHLRNGQALEAQGDLDGALAQYREALKVGGMDHSQAEARVLALSPTPSSVETEPGVDASDVLTASETLTQTAQPDPDGQYDLSLMGARPNCTRTGVIGVIKDHDGTPVQGAQVQVRNSVGKSWTSSPSDVDGQYKITVANGPVADIWTAYVVGGDQPVSPSYSFRTDSGCVNGLQEYKIDWQRR